MKLAVLLVQSLRKALQELEKRLLGGQPRVRIDLPGSLSVLPAVQSLQVNVYLRCLDAETVCLFNETVAIGA